MDMDVDFAGEFMGREVSQQQTNVELAHKDYFKSFDDDLDYSDLN